jgi:hypothetical protein
MVEVFRPYLGQQKEQYAEAVEARKLFIASVLTLAGSCRSTAGKLSPRTRPGTLGDGCLGHLSAAAATRSICLIALP